MTIVVSADDSTPYSKCNCTFDMLQQLVLASERDLTFETLSIGVESGLLANLSVGKTEFSLRVFLWLMI